MRDALAFGPTAPQTGDNSGTTAAGSPAQQSEDCLVVNIWTRGLNDGGRRPVMLWLHGGGYAGGTGADLCQRLKGAGVPACLVISTLDARDQALAAGADAFLRKPLDPLQFVSTVKDLLGKSAFLQGATSL